MKAGGHEAARLNKRGRQEVQWGEMYRSNMGIKHPSKCKRHRTNSGLWEGEIM